MEYDKLCYRNGHTDNTSLDSVNIRASVISGRYTMVLGGDIYVTLTHFREVYNDPGRGHLCNIDTFLFLSHMIVLYLSKECRVVCVYVCVCGGGGGGSWVLYHFIFSG